MPFMVLEAFIKNLAPFVSILWIQEARLLKATPKQSKTRVKMILWLIEHCAYILAW